MIKAKKSAELLWTLGIIFVALGVAICSKADLGVSMIAAPAFVVYDAVKEIWSGFSVGMTEYAIQGLMLMFLCLIVRKFNWKYLLAFGVAVIYGYVLDFFLWLLDGVSFDPVWLRWIMLIIGDAITALGVACFFRTYMPLQVYELFVAELSDVFKLNITKTKWTFDITLLFISSLLTLVLFDDRSSLNLNMLCYSSYHNIGLGTLVTTLINSPIIAFMGKCLDRIFDKTARFSKLESLLKRS